VQNIELVRVKKEDREILANLLEKHLYEFSQWDLKEVNPLGLYGYQYLDYYFTGIAPESPYRACPASAVG